MPSSASVALEFLGVQNASDTNRTVLKGSSGLEISPEKHLPKLRFTQDLSRIKPQMMQKVFSGLSEYNKTDSAHLNCQTEGFNGRSELSSQPEMLELFPVSTGSGFGSNPRVAEKKITLPFAIGQTDLESRSGPEKAPEQQSTPQLTIFYNGAMRIYDVPAEKAEAIMRLAGANSSSNTRTSEVSSGKIEQISKPLPSKPASDAVTENQLDGRPIGLQIVRKLSLERFLQKRKERFNSVAPYNTMKPATLPSEAEKKSEDQIILSLA